MNCPSYKDTIVHRIMIDVHDDYRNNPHPEKNYNEFLYDYFDRCLFVNAISQPTETIRIFHFDDSSIEFDIINFIWSVYD